MNMIRKQVFVTKEQSRQLKARARVAGVSEAALIRAGIDRELMVSNDTAAWKERLMRMAGSLKDTTCLETAIQQNRAGWRERVEQTRKRLTSEE